MIISTKQLGRSGGSREIPPDLIVGERGIEATSETIPAHDTKISEARLVGRFTWAHMMLREAAEMLDQENVEAYIAHREKLHNQLEELADDMRLPENKINRNSIVKRKEGRMSLEDFWVKEEERIQDRVGGLEARARAIAAQQGKSKDILR